MIFRTHIKSVSLQTTVLRASFLLLAFLLGGCVTTPADERAGELIYNFERIPSDEAVQIGDISIKTGALQRKRAEVFNDAQNGQILRGVHPKSHGCVLADFNVLPDVAANHQVGLFAGGEKTYKALIRYSNASVRITDDRERDQNGVGKNGSRGMAIKIFDVGEDVIVKDAGSNNQDFLMINTRAFAFPNVRSYQRLTNALLSSPSGADPRGAFVPADDWTAEDVANLEKTLKVIGLIRQKTVRDPTEVAFFGAAPSLFGRDRVMKFSTEPCDGEKPQMPFDEEPDDHYLRQALVARMAQDAGPVCLDFKVQLIGIEQVRADRNAATAENPSDLIEDATRVWDENEYPFTNVAKIIIPTTRMKGESAVIDCESNVFNPWHSLADHKPVGGINRLRKPVYISSAANRRSGR